MWVGSSYTRSIISSMTPSIRIVLMQPASAKVISMLCGENAVCPSAANISLRSYRRLAIRCLHSVLSDWHSRQSWQEPEENIGSCGMQPWLAGFDRERLPPYVEASLSAQTI